MLAGIQLWSSYLKSESRSGKGHPASLNGEEILSPRKRRYFRLYLPANDSAAFAAKPFTLFGLPSMTFISRQS